MQQSNGIHLHHQKFMLAVRHEMGWPSFRPANDSIAFCSGKAMDFAVGSEVARISEQMRKDAVYTGWASTTAALPSGFTIIYRQMLCVDVIDRVVPYAANDTAPIVFVSTRGDEIFLIDDRGSLVKLQGKPKNIGTGRKLAMKRIKATAAGMGDALLDGNRFVPTGEDWIEPAPPADTIVRFA